MGKGQCGGHLCSQGLPGQCHQEGQSKTTWETSLSPAASPPHLEPNPSGAAGQLGAEPEGIVSRCHWVLISADILQSTTLGHPSRGPQCLAQDPCCHLECAGPSSQIGPTVPSCSWDSKGLSGQLICRPAPIGVPAVCSHQLGAVALKPVPLPHSHTCACPLGRLLAPPCPCQRRASHDPVLPAACSC